MKKWIIAAIAVVVIGAVIVGVQSMQKTAETAKSQESQEKEAAALPPVKADSSVVADGKVAPVRSVTLSFNSSGVVASVLVKDGDKVKVGQTLARLDAARQTAAVAQAEAQVLRAQAHLDEMMAGARAPEVAAATASLEGAKARLARVKAGSPPLEIAIAEADVKAAQAQLDLVKAGPRPESIAAAKADVTAAKATLAQAEVSLSETELKAPFAGAVAGVKLSKGEFIGPGAQLLRVVDTAEWQIQTEDLTEINVVKVKPGDAVSVTFDAIPGLQLPGKVTGINPLGENKSGDITYTVTVRPDRQDARLRWNMTATVTIKPKQ